MKKQRALPIKESVVPRKPFIDRGTCMPLGFLVVGLACHSPTASVQPLADPIPGARAIAFEAVEDNIAHDTLLTQTTFDLRDGTFVMVASNKDDTWEGLRLYRYRPRPDNSAHLLAISNPAYDSWTMLPSFFAADTTGRDGFWVLANFGERESWGQKLMRLDSAFHDLGFLDATAIEWVDESDGRVRKRRNIGPFARFDFSGDSTWIRFACDSVYLYDDQNGQQDVVLATSRIRFLHAPGEGLSLWVDEEKRPVRQPG